MGVLSVLTFHENDVAIPPRGPAFVNSRSWMQPWLASAPHSWKMRSRSSLQTCPTRENPQKTTKVSSQPCFCQL
eukprot:2637345-Amphidinium_carterae.1